MADSTKEAEPPVTGGRLTAGATLADFYGRPAAPTLPGGFSVMPQQASADKQPVAHEQIPEIADAISRFQRKDFDGAMALLESACKKNPDLPPPQTLRAELFARSGGITTARDGRAPAYNGPMPRGDDAGLVGNVVIDEQNRNAATLYGPTRPKSGWGYKWVGEGLSSLKIEEVTIG